MIEVFINGIPKAQPRTRATIRGKHAGVYDPGTANEWKNTVKAAFGRYTGLRLEGPLALDITFYLPRPKRLCRKKDPDDPIPHTAKPDRDNLDKAVLDALTDIQVWGDDKQVFSGKIEKYYGSKNGTTGAVVRITKR